MERELKITFDVITSYEALNDVEKNLYNKAKNIREKAYANYSNFLVGCALLLDNGEIVMGSNQENAAYPSGLCAERTAIFWTSANYPEAQILKMFVIGGPRDVISKQAIPPCGACRQSILEYEAKQTNKIEIYFASVNGEIYKTKSVRDLLPFSFDSSFL